MQNLLTKTKVMWIMVMMVFTSTYTFQCSGFCPTHTLAVPQSKGAGIALVYLTKGSQGIYCLALCKSGKCSCAQAEQ